ncbi:OmpA family protein [Fluoribacter dumoffii]|uniref:Outer membrane protein ArfA n=1 Tax=Fluoribacter dumoffii TaxID=463 RepID=A0A377G5F0_9GAMM|nr:OmpA family protein [Fluoribacter dumoffii]KTC91528.1 sodium-type flagellar protein [Fluoribacter dumoffii NY 23]MCW8387349.1 OmpA family protein [Fluoribacter dumoffii]MCW8417144.1 OmpA family protein [Fluoribacter dumoffii]MCW8455016.1 OmpA family protein [Fluoribacter dumoffii]MCW8460907.1 OmpA family protein [Fluoribacter dumoffii]
MAFVDHKGQFLTSIALSALLTLSSGYSMTQMHFANPLGAKGWRVSRNPIRCGLSLTIPNYGIAYFEQYAAKPPHFILRTWDEVQRFLPGKIFIKAPVWKPEVPPALIGQMVVKPGEFGLYLKREAALKLLAFLLKGYEPNFSYRAETGFTTTVALSPVGFQKPYSRYQECIGNLLPFDYQQIRESVFHYKEDGRDLTDAYKEQLRRIARYVDADPQIKEIRVIGYADANGRKGYNNAISEERAREVKNYLLKLGVPKEKLYVTWVGELDPIARNDTDAGRAANRRVVITLVKK